MLYDALFQTTKIQIFESNSQPGRYWLRGTVGCFRLQRYKFLKAIHNNNTVFYADPPVVSDYKDTNFWKQFTTIYLCVCKVFALFQTTKIQIFESNSQRIAVNYLRSSSCFRLQRYKFLKAIHNVRVQFEQSVRVVSDYKDTNFWKQFTTQMMEQPLRVVLFQTTKIQIFESNSQLTDDIKESEGCCFRLQRYKFLKAIHNYRE